MSLSQFCQRPIRRLSCFLSLCVVLALTVSGCGRKADVQSQTSELEKAFSAASQAQGSSATKGYVQQAVTAARANDYVTAILMLQNAIRTGDATPEQLTAVENAQTAIYTDLNDRAGKGDAKAKEALDALAKAANAR
jgi:hypothetical protein